MALAAGPVAAALITGNTVVLKGAAATSWAGRIARRLRCGDAEVSAGRVFDSLPARVERSARRSSTIRSLPG